MLQQNNNNNYSCLERACGSREALQERERSVLPLAKLLEMGSFHELGNASGRGPVRGFRAWAMSNICARSRRWAALPPGNSAPCLKRPDAMPPCQTNSMVGNLRPQKGRLTQGQAGVGLGLQLDASAWGRSSRNRRGGLGALVTVATLKASERGGQTQTQCFLLQAKGQSYLCAAGRRRTLAPGLWPEPPSSLVGPGGVGAAAGGKGNEQREGPAVGALKIKPRPVRKWRTSCEVASSIKERAHWDCEDKEFSALEESQESRAKRASCTSRQDAQAGQQDGRGAETSRTAPAKICTQCRGVRDRPAISSRRTAEDSDQSNSGEGRDKVTLPMSGPCVCRLPAHPADPETDGSNGERQGPINGDIQEGPQTKFSTPKGSRFQDLLGDKSPRLGASSKGEAPGALRNIGNLEAGCIEGAHGHCEGEIESEKVRETEAFSDNDFEGRRTDGRMSSTGCGREKGGLPCECVAADAPEGHSCEEACSPVRRAHLAAGSTGHYSAPAEVEDTCEQTQRPTLSDSSPGEVGDLCQGRPLDSMGSEDGERSTNLPADLSLRASGQAVGPGTNGIEEAGLLDGHGGEQTKSGGRRRGRDGAEGPCTEAPSSVMGGQRGEDEGNGNPIWQLDNSLSRGADSAAAATHTPPNLAPPGAMATDHSAPGGQQAVPPSVGEQRQQQQGWQGGMVASGDGRLDAEQEGDDDFGLFVRAGEQPSWDDGFTEFHQVPCGRSERTDPVSEGEPAHWTTGEAESLLRQSEDTWAAFSQEGSVGLGPGPGGQQQQQTPPGCQWWTQKAVEELGVKLPRPLDVPSVFLEAFPSTPPSCPYPNPVVSLRQLLQGCSCDDGTDGDSGSLLDRLQDVNRIIGLKCKWAESHSQKRLLQSLHLDTGSNKSPFQGHVTGSRLANDSPPVGLPPFSQRTPPMGDGKTRQSYDVNKNVLA